MRPGCRCVMQGWVAPTNALWAAEERGAMPDRDPRNTSRALGPGGAGALARTPIRIPKTAEIVADEIRRMITRGELKEGDTLQPEAQIIENFSVSRPDRARGLPHLGNRKKADQRFRAVSRGGGAGCMRLRPSRWPAMLALCCKSRRATYADVYQARSVIEPPSARLVAETRSKDAPAILRQVIEEEQRQAGPTDQFGRAVAQFHSKLIELTGNQTLILLSGDPRRHRRAGPVGGDGADRASSQQAAATPRPAYARKRSWSVISKPATAPRPRRNWRRHMENAAKIWLSGGAGDTVGRLGRLSEKTCF